MILLLSLWAQAAVMVDPAPVQGAESTITLLDDSGAPRPGVTVRVFHGRGLELVEEVAVGITDARGRALWTPQRAGRTVVHSEHEERAVHVAWAGPPRGLLALLLVLLLASGAAVVHGRGSQALTS